MVIPARALNELVRVLADIDDPVEVVLAAARNQILFHLEGIDLVSRLIDGQFPNYQQVVPQSHTTRAVLDREELLRAVRPAALIAHESANIVKLQVGADGEAGVTVSANAEVGDHVGQVEAAVEGDGTTIAFNARYLADVLTNVDADQFALELNGPLSPGVFKPVGDDQLRPRRHAGPDDVLARMRRPARLARTDDPARDHPPARPPRLRLARRGVRTWTAPRLGPERGRQDEPARGDGPAGLGPVASDIDGRRADPLGHRPRPGRGRGRAATRSRSRSSAPGRDRGRPAASGSASTASAARAAALAGLLRVVCSRPRRCCSSPARPGSGAPPSTSWRRRARRPTRDALTTYGRALQQRNSLLRAIREDGASRDELRFWDGTFLDAGGAIVDERLRLLGDLAAPLAAAHAEIAPEEAAAARLTLRYATNAPALPGESPRDALARRLAETAEKEVWNGSTLVGPGSTGLVRSRCRGSRRRCT